MSSPFPSSSEAVSAASAEFSRLLKNGYEEVSCQVIDRVHNLLVQEALAAEMEYQAELEAEQQNGSEDEQKQVQEIKPEPKSHNKDKQERKDKKDQKDQKDKKAKPKQPRAPSPPKEDFSGLHLTTVDSLSCFQLSPSLCVQTTSPVKYYASCPAWTCYFLTHDIDPSCPFEVQLRHPSSGEEWCVVVLPTAYWKVKKQKVRSRSNFNEKKRVLQHVREAFRTRYDKGREDSEARRQQAPSGVGATVDRMLVSVLLVSLGSR